MAYLAPSVFCGDNSPPNYRTFGTFTMTLNTDASLSKRGFRLSYETENCGGDITEETEIASISPNTKYTNIRTNYPASHLICSWNITAPPGKLVVVE